MLGFCNVPSGDGDTPPPPPTGAAPDGEPAAAALPVVSVDLVVSSFDIRLAQLEAKLETARGETGGLEAKLEARCERLEATVVRQLSALRLSTGMLAADSLTEDLEEMNEQGLFRGPLLGPLFGASAARGSRVAWQLL